MSGAAPSALPPASWWEEHFFPRLEALVQDAVADLGALVAGTGGAARTPAGQTLQGVPFRITLPSSPLALARLATDAGVAGISIPLILREVLTVPANGSGGFTVPVPTGVVYVLGDRLRGYSTVHDPSIVANILADNINPILTEAAITADIDLILTAYGVLRSELAVTITNGTANPVTVTLDAPIIIVAATEYDTVWRPYFHFAYRTIATTARVDTGGTP